MFKNLWNAFTNLTNALNGLAASVTEANSNFRDRLGLDDRDEPEQLTYEPVADGKRRRAAVK